jgi:hypothetical protein
MSKAAFLKRLRGNPDEFKIADISDHVILFLNQWKCMVKDDDVTAEAIERVSVESKRVLRNLGSKTALI